MNILYILGNGFDKAQGLATTYKEFYKEWLKREPESELEQKVLASIQGDYQTWADLEKGLGEYSAKWEDEQVFLDILKLFNIRLKEYLIAQNNRLAEMQMSRAKLTLIYVNLNNFWNQVDVRYMYSMHIGGVQMLI